MIKKKKSQNLNLFSLTQYQTLKPFTPNTPYPAHSFTKLNNFCNVGSVRWRATNVLRASEIE